MKKWNVYAAAVLAAVGILGGCGAKNAESQAPAETQAAEQSAQESSVEESRETSAEESKTETEKNGTLSVTYVKSPLNVPSIVEQDQEIFASVFGPMGYDVQYSDLTTGPEQTQALASGDIQFLNAVGATSVILSASNDADIKIMSIYSRSPKAFKLFAKDDSIKTAEDLKGKKVAGPGSFGRWKCRRGSSCRSDCLQYGKRRILCSDRRRRSYRGNHRYCNQ